MFRARKTFFVGRRKVSADELVEDDDPVLEGRASLFVPVDPYGRPVEQDATPDDEALRERARELGIKRVGTKSTDRLAAEVAEAEEALAQSDTSAGPEEGVEPTEQADEAEDTEEAL